MSNITPIVAKNAGEAITPGAVWVSVWGYDAAIASFFIVTCCTSKSIWLAEINVAYVNGNNWAADEATPALPINRIGPENRHVLKDSQYGLRVKRNSYSSIYPWDGTPIHTYNWH